MRNDVEARSSFVPLAPRHIRCDVDEGGTLKLSSLVRTRIIRERIKREPFKLEHLKIGD